MKTETSLVPVKSRGPLQSGDRPVHRHRCPAGDHEWECNSPYCNFLLSDCPEHEGIPPIVQGYEPWKGR